MRFLFFLLPVILFASLPKDYYKIKDIKEQKKFFFDYFYKIIKKENLKVLNKRLFVQRFFNNFNPFLLNPDSLEFKQLIKIAKEYKIKDVFDKKAYLRHIDIVPISLALAQAAIESGWGKSRFVKEANNVFGQWTYTGKGLIPTNRDEGATHKIKIFDSIDEAIKGYIKNLNVGWGYKEFRLKREKLREENKKLYGLYLINTMHNYSALKEKYIDILEKVIKKNNLIEYDKKFFKELK